MHDLRKSQETPTDYSQLDERGKGYHARANRLDLHINIRACPSCGSVNSWLRGMPKRTHCGRCGGSL